MQNKIIFISITLILMVGCMKPTQNDQNCKDGVCSLTNRPNTSSTESVHNTQESSVIELTTDTFTTTITTAKKPVIVDFYATWCQPCKNVKPIFAELAQEEDWVFCSIDVDKAPTVAAQCNVTAMPTFVVFKNGIQWGSVKGGMQKEQLKAELEKIITAPAPASAALTDEQCVQQLMMAIAQRSIEAIKQLIAEGVNINGTLATPQGNYSVMQIAISAGNEEIIDLLIAAGAIMDSSIQQATEKQLALGTATVESFEQNLNYLKSKIAVSEPKTSTNNAELGQQFLMAMMNPSTLKDLLAKNVDVNCTFVLGKSEITPLYLAVAFNNREAMDMLIDAGASLSTLINDDNGCKKTVLDTMQAELDTLKQGLIRGKERLQYASAKAGL